MFPFVVMNVHADANLAKSPIESAFSLNLDENRYGYACFLPFDLNYVSTGGRLSFQAKQVFIKKRFHNLLNE